MCINTNIDNNSFENLNPVCQKLLYMWPPVVAFNYFVIFWSPRPGCESFWSQVGLQHASLTLAVGFL